MTTFAARLFKILAYMIYSLPRRVQLFLGSLLGLLWFDVIRLRRRVIFENLAKAFPEMGQAEKVRIGRLSCINLGCTFIEFFWLPFLNRETSLSRFRFEGFEHLDRALAQGRGVALLSLHIGNGDMGLAGIALRGYPLQMISKEFSTRWLNDIWFRVREKLGMKFIPPRMSSLAILKALKMNQVVVFAQDQFMGPPIGVKTTFFGHETGTALGLAVIVARSRSPVIPVYTYREKDGTTLVRCEPEVPWQVVGDRDESLVQMTQIYNYKLEELIRRHPDQWMWVHRRWKEFKH